MNKNKKTTSAIATLTAAAIALSGTFAWTSFSQQARNDAMETVRPGARLHDDFSGYNYLAGGLTGKTKDIYVENYGEVPVYARIRLDEFMEIGANAGTMDGTKGNSASTVKPLVAGTDIDDVSTWTTHLPQADDLSEGTEGAFSDANKTFHKYFSWTLGGEEADNAKATTIYKPTFNMNKDSKDAEVNGTLAGPDGKIDRLNEDAYQDYVKYEAGTDYTDTEKWDADDNDLDEEPGKEGAGGELGVNYTTQEKKHTTKSTLESMGVISMADYLAKSETERKEFVGWVWDTDGWAYWSQAIPAGEATGLLLDSITLNEKPDDEWYYGINVVGQFATASDVGEFMKAGNGAIASKDALSLLKTAGADVGDYQAGDKVTIGGDTVNENGTATANKGSKTDISKTNADGNKTEGANLEVKSVSPSTGATPEKIRIVDGKLVVDTDCPTGEYEVTIHDKDKNTDTVIKVNVPNTNAMPVKYDGKEYDGTTPIIIDPTKTNTPVTVDGSGTYTYAISPANSGVTVDENGYITTDDKYDSATDYKLIITDKTNGDKTEVPIQIKSDGTEDTEGKKPVVTGADGTSLAGTTQTVNRGESLTVNTKPGTGSTAAESSITVSVSPATGGVTYENGEVSVSEDATKGDYTITLTDPVTKESTTFTVTVPEKQEATSGEAEDSNGNIFQDGSSVTMNRGDTKTFPTDTYTVSGGDDTNVTVDPTTGTVTVAADATAGTYQIVVHNTAKNTDTKINVVVPSEFPTEWSSLNNAVCYNCVAGMSKKIYMKTDKMSDYVSFDDEGGIKLSAGTKLTIGWSASAVARYQTINMDTNETHTTKTGSTGGTVNITFSKTGNYKVLLGNVASEFDNDTKILYVCVE